MGPIGYTTIEKVTQQQGSGYTKKNSSGFRHAEMELKVRRTREPPFGLLFLMIRLKRLLTILHLNLSNNTPMSIAKSNKKANQLRKKMVDKPIPTATNDGMNTPVKDQTSTQVLTENEKWLYNQAENRLGDPDRE